MTKGLSQSCEDVLMRKVVQMSSVGKLFPQNLRQKTKQPAGDLFTPTPRSWMGLSRPRYIVATFLWECQAPSRLLTMTRTGFMTDSSSAETLLSRFMLTLSRRRGFWRRGTAVSGGLIIRSYLILSYPSWSYQIIRESLVPRRTDFDPDSLAEVDPEYIRRSLGKKFSIITFLHSRHFRTN